LSSSISCHTALPLKQAEQQIRATEAWSIWCQDNSKAQYRCQQTLWDFNDTTTFEWIKLALAQANL
jgi:hypothetical protein